MPRRVGPLLVVLGVSALLPGPVSAEEKKQREVVVTSPKAGDKVEQFTDVEGRMNVKEGWPVVLVKPLVGDQPWWVQSPVESVENGKFIAASQFGDAATKEGTKFRIVIVLAPSKAAAMKFEKGMQRSSPPAGLTRSDYVTVTR